MFSDGSIKFYGASKNYVFKKKNNLSHVRFKGFIRAAIKSTESNILRNRKVALSKD